MLTLQRTKEAWFKDNYQDPYLAQDNALDDVKTYLQSAILTKYDHAVVLTR